MSSSFSLCPSLLFLTTLFVFLLILFLYILYLLFLRTVYDLSKSVDDVMLLEQESNSLNMIIFLSRNPQEAVTMVTEINGKSLIPPPWEFGPWNQLQDEDPSKTQSQRIEEFFFKYDIPCSHAINTVHFFPHGGEKGREQELKKENDKLLSLGVKSTAYFNAMLETGYTELYNYAATHDYLLKNEDGLPYNYSYIGASKFFVSQIDFTNPQAVTWYQQQLERSVNLSFHGWMYDYGEYTPHDSVSHDGTYGLKMHNEFSHLYQKAAFDYLTTLDPNPNDEYAPDYVFYVRSSYTGSQKYTWAHWTGDPSSDWSYASGLPAQITASLNIGLSGMPFSGSDIGGFEWYVDPAPDLDLWSRWTAAGCVSGLMHEQGGGKGTGPKSHIFDFPNGTLIWRKFAKLRMQLFPYIYTQAHISHDTGLPIMRHHLIQFWNDSKAISQNQQYMFGDVFLTAPVVDENKKSQIVYLPSYNSTDRPGPLWIDVGSGFIYDEQDGRYRIGFTGYHNGGQLVNVPVLLDNVPLFVMAGSIVPILDPRVMTLNNATNDSVITWNKLKHIRHVWVFVDENFNASGHSWDTDVYKLTHYQTNLLIFNIIGAPNDYIHIIQIAGPWKSLGLPVSVETDSHEIEVVKGWEQLVQDNSGEGYYYDDINSVLWLRLVIHETAKIHINNL